MAVETLRHWLNQARCSGGWGSSRRTGKMHGLSGPSFDSACSWSWASGCYDVAAHPMWDPSQATQSWKALVTVAACSCGSGQDLQSAVPRTFEPFVMVASSWSARSGSTRSRYSILFPVRSRWAGVQFCTSTHGLRSSCICPHETQSALYSRPFSIWGWWLSGLHRPVQVYRVVDGPRVQTNWSHFTEFLMWSG